MDGIRTLASIFYGLGWVILGVAMLVGCGMLLLGIFALDGRAGDGFASLLTSLMTLGAASLWPFFCWAVLSLLLEIHTMQQSVLRATVRAAEAVGSATVGPPARSVVPSIPLQSLPRPITVTPPDQAPQTVECPNCGRPNSTWRSVCADCRATLA